MTPTQNLYNANDGLTGRSGGPYLDQEMAKAAEIRRAKAEDREPDLVNPPSGPETRLVTAEQILLATSVNNLPSEEGRIAINAEAALQALVDGNVSTLTVSTTIPVVVAEEVVVEETPTPEDVTDETEEF